MFGKPGVNSENNNDKKWGLIHYLNAYKEGRDDVNRNLTVWLRNQKAKEKALKAIHLELSTGVAQQGNIRYGTFVSNAYFMNEKAKAVNPANDKEVIDNIDTKFNSAASAQAYMKTFEDTYEILELAGKLIDFTEQSNFNKKVEPFSSRKSKHGFKAVETGGYSGSHLFSRLTALDGLTTVQAIKEKLATLNESEKASLEEEFDKIETTLLNLPDRNIQFSPEELHKGKAIIDYFNSRFAVSGAINPRVVSRDGDFNYIDGYAAVVDKEVNNKLKTNRFSDISPSKVNYSVLDTFKSKLASFASAVNRVNLSKIFVSSTPSPNKQNNLERYLSHTYDNYSNVDYVTVEGEHESDLSTLSVPLLKAVSALMLNKPVLFKKGSSERLVQASKAIVGLIKSNDFTGINPDNNYSQLYNYLQDLNNEDSKNLIAQGEEVLDQEDNWKTKSGDYILLKPKDVELESSDFITEGQARSTVKKIQSNIDYSKSSEGTFSEEENSLTYSKNPAELDNVVVNGKLLDTVNKIESDSSNGNRTIFSHNNKIYELNKDGSVKRHLDYNFHDIDSSDSFASLIDFLYEEHFIGEADAAILRSNLSYNQDRIAVDAGVPSKQLTFFGKLKPEKVNNVYISTTPLTGKSYQDVISDKTVLVSNASLINRLKTEFNSLTEDQLQATLPTLGKDKALVPIIKEMFDTYIDFVNLTAPQSKAINDGNVNAVLKTVLTSLQAMAFPNSYFFSGVKGDLMKETINKLSDLTDKFFDFNTSKYYSPNLKSMVSLGTNKTIKPYASVIIEDLNQAQTKHFLDHSSHIPNIIIAPKENNHLTDHPSKNFKLVYKDEGVAIYFNDVHPENYRGIFSFFNAKEKQSLTTVDTKTANYVLSVTDKSVKAVEDYGVNVITDINNEDNIIFPSGIKNSFSIYLGKLRSRAFEVGKRYIFDDLFSVDSSKSVLSQIDKMIESYHSEEMNKAFEKFNKSLHKNPQLNFNTLFRGQDSFVMQSLVQLLFKVGHRDPLKIGKDFKRTNEVMYIPEDISRAMFYAAQISIGKNYHGLIESSDDVIKFLLNKNEIDIADRNKYKYLGQVKEVFATEVGKVFLRMNGIRTKEEGNKDLESNFAASIGLFIVNSLIEQGYLEQRNIASSEFSDGKSINSIAGAANFIGLARTGLSSKGVINKSNINDSSAFEKARSNTNYPSKKDDEVVDIKQDTFDFFKYFSNISSSFESYDEDIDYNIDITKSDIKDFKTLYTALKIIESMTGVTLDKKDINRLANVLLNESGIEKNLLTLDTAKASISQISSLRIAKLAFNVFRDRTELLAESKAYNDIAKKIINLKLDEKDEDIYPMFKAVDNNELEFSDSSKFNDMLVKYANTSFGINKDNRSIWEYLSDTNIDIKERRSFLFAIGGIHKQYHKLSEGTKKANASNVLEIENLLLHIESFNDELKKQGNGLDSDLFFKWIIQRNTRTSIASRLNPQMSKLVRILISPSNSNYSFKVSSNSDTEIKNLLTETLDNIQRFQKELLNNNTNAELSKIEDRKKKVEELITKHKLDSSRGLEGLFLLASVGVHAGVKLKNSKNDIIDSVMSVVKETRNHKDFLTKDISSLAKNIDSLRNIKTINDEQYQGFYALRELSKYLNANRSSDFSTSLFTEGDSITSGSTISYLLMGIDVGSSNTALNEGSLAAIQNPALLNDTVNTNGSALDVYEQSGDLISKAVTEVISSLGKDPGTYERTLINAIVESLNLNSNIKALRKRFKTPSQELVYGGAIPLRIINFFINELLNSSSGGGVYGYIDSLLLSGNDVRNYKGLFETMSQELNDSSSKKHSEAVILEYYLIEEYLKKHSFSYKSKSYNDISKVFSDQEKDKLFEMIRKQIQNEEKPINIRKIDLSLSPILYDLYNKKVGIPFHKSFSEILGGRQIFNKTLANVSKFFYRTHAASFNMLRNSLINNSRVKFSGFGDMKIKEIFGIKEDITLTDLLNKIKNETVNTKDVKKIEKLINLLSTNKERSALLQKMPTTAAKIISYQLNASGEFLVNSIMKHYGLSFDVEIVDGKSIKASTSELGKTDSSVSDITSIVKNEGSGQAILQSAINGRRMREGPPVLSFGPSSTHTFDTYLLNKVMEYALNNNLLPLYDAFAGSPLAVMTGSVLYGKAMTDLPVDHNFIEVLEKKITKIADFYKDKLSMQNAIFSNTTDAELDLDPDYAKSSFDSVFFSLIDDAFNSMGDSDEKFKELVSYAKENSLSLRFIIDQFNAKAQSLTDDKLKLKIYNQLANLSKELGSKDELVNLLGSIEMFDDFFIIGNKTDGIDDYLSKNEGLTKVPKQSSLVIPISSVAAALRKKGVNIKSNSSIGKLKNKVKLISLIDRYRQLDKLKSFQGKAMANFSFVGTAVKWNSVDIGNKINDIKLEIGEELKSFKQITIYSKIKSLADLDDQASKLYLNLQREGSIVQEEYKSFFENYSDLKMYFNLIEILDKSLVEDRINVSDINIEDINNNYIIDIIKHTKDIGSISKNLKDALSEAGLHKGIAIGEFDLKKLNSYVAKLNGQDRELYFNIINSYNKIIHGIAQRTVEESFIPGKLGRQEVPKTFPSEKITLVSSAYKYFQDESKDIAFDITEILIDQLNGDSVSDDKIIKFLKRHTENVAMKRIVNYNELLRKVDHQKLRKYLEYIDTSNIYMSENDFFSFSDINNVKTQVAESESDVYRIAEGIIDSDEEVGAEHKDYLKKLMRTLSSKFFQKITFREFSSNKGGNLGQIRIDKGEVSIDLIRSKFNDFLSNHSKYGVVVAHELVHAFSAEMLDTLTSKEKNILNFIYNKTREELNKKYNNLGYKIFLSDEAHHTDKEIERAKNLYNYIFNNTSSTKGVGLAEFVAFALSEEKFGKFVDSFYIPKKAMSFKRLEGQSFKEYISYLFNQFIDLL